MIKLQEIPTPTYTVKKAETPEELEQAFRLRYEVFVKEKNNDQLKNEAGIETDAYDEVCDHLIVVDQTTGQVVGTYRMLPGERALRHKGFYSQTEFDLTHFEPYMLQAVEMGRSCIAKEYRTGGVIQLLWSGIADYIKRSGHRYLFGCVSLPMERLEDMHAIYSVLINDGVISEDYRIFPLESHRIPGLRVMETDQLDARRIRKMLPPLLKGYQRLGAKIAGEPAIDSVFQTIDFFVVLDTENISSKYRNHFLP
jgi:putative hemolysin